MLKITLSHLLITILPTFVSCLIPQTTVATKPYHPDKTINCDILIAGSGLSGVATAYEGLLAGKRVCLTEITDWLGGQISSQGTSALDERPTQRSQLFYSRGYLELRQRIQNHYNQLNPGTCWVSNSCFLPNYGHHIINQMLQDAAKKGRGRLHWFPNTVIKELDISSNGQLINSVIAIKHRPAKGRSPLNTFPLS